MVSLCLRSLALLAVLSGAHAARGGATLTINPIRRVVQMLQMMQKKVVEEGEKDEALFEKFQCYCKTGAKSLEASIAEADAKIPQVQSSLDESIAQMGQLEKDLVEHKQDRADAEDALAKATGLREKEAAEFLKESSDDKANVAALGKAIAALEKGTGSFLQTSAASAVRRLTVSMELSSADRDMLASFLSEGEGYAPQSGQIVGILKQMKETMEKDLAAIVAEEDKAKGDYDSLVAAKEKEVKSTTAAIESKLGRHGNTGVKIESLKEDLEDTTKSLEQDKKFLADLGTNCEKKKAEFEVVKKTRADELLAIAETVKILNDDDALELFKKALPSPSLLQTRSGREVRQQALRALTAGRRGRAALADPRLDFLALALRGKKVSFDKVLTMVDDMVSLLAKEQDSDDKKKAYCEAELDKNEDAKKELDLAVSDLGKAIEDAKGSIATLADEVAALEQGIKDLDAQVAEATENRKAEHAEYSETLANDRAAKEVLELATNRLQKFYNPALYKAPAKQERSAEDRMYENMGGDLSTTPAPAFVQLSARRGGGSAAPPPPPEAFNAYAKKGQETTGVVEMVKMLAADLDKEVQQIEVEEKDAQAEYELLLEDSKAKRAADAKSIEEKEAAKADLEAETQKLALEEKSKLKEAMATAETIRDLHLECDWLVANFAARKDARAGEVESLKNAKAVLSGADYSLVQTVRAHFRGTLQ